MSNSSFYGSTFLCRCGSTRSAATRIDFAYPELVLGDEIESVRAHAAREDVHPQCQQANELLDWWILRFAFDDVHRWPDETAELLERTIVRRRRAA